MVASPGKVRRFDGERASVTAGPSTEETRVPLGRRAARGGVLQILGYILGRVPVLGATIVIARILAPDEFGTVAIALVVVAFLESIHDLGVGQAVVYLPDEREVAGTALLIALIGSFALVATVWMVAPIVATAIDETETAPLLRVLALTLILGAVAQVPDGLMRKRLQFGRRTVAVLFRSVGRAGSSVALAIAGLGVWSIAWGYVLGDILYLAATWILSGYRPRRSELSLDPDSRRAILSFGLPVAFAVLLTGLIFTIDSLIVASSLGSRAMGIYTIAQRIPDAAITSVFFVISGVAYPVFRAASSHAGRLKSGYLTALRLQVGFVFVGAVVLAASGPAIVPLLLGDEWLTASRPLQFLAFHAAGLSLATGATDVFKAIGRPRLAMWTMLMQLCLLIPVLLIAARHDVETIAAVAAAAALLAAVLMHGVAIRLLEVRPGAAVSAVLPPLLVAAAVGSAMWIGRFLGPDSAFLMLVVQLGLGAVAGLLALGAVWRSLPADLHRLLAPDSRGDAVSAGRMARIVRR